MSAGRGVRQLRHWGVVSRSTFPVSSALAASLPLGFLITTVAAEVGSPYLLLVGGVVVTGAVAAFSYPWTGVLVIFSSFLFGSESLYAGAVSLEWVQLAVVYVGAVLLARWLAAWHDPFPWAPAMWPGAALVVWTLVSLPSAIDTALAIKQIALLAGGLLTALVVLAGCRNLLELRLVLVGLVAAATVISLTAFSEGVGFSVIGGAETVEGRLTGVFDQPNQLGSFCALTAPIAAGLAFSARTRLARVAAYMSAGTILVCLTFTLSRGAWIGTAIAFGYMLLRLSEARRAAAVLVVPVVATAALVLAFAPAQPTSIQIVGQRASAIRTLSPYDDRDSIYSEAWRQIKEDPLIGQGAGGFPTASSRYQADVTTVSAFHAHNLLLTWTAETGLIGLVIVIALIVALGQASASTVRRLNQVDRRHGVMVVGLSAGLISVMGQGIVDYVLRNAINSTVTWAVVGGLLVAQREARRLW